MGRKVISGKMFFVFAAVALLALFSQVAAAAATVTPSYFGCTEVVSNKLPASITCWVAATCSGRFMYKPGPGYAMVNCTGAGKTGVHGGCPNCAMSLITAKSTGQPVVTPTPLPIAHAYGYVLNSSGAGIPGAKVIISSEDGDSRWVFYTNADSQGYYRMVVWPGKAMRITAQAHVFFGGQVGIPAFKTYEARRIDVRMNATVTPKATPTPKPSSCKLTQASQFGCTQVVSSNLPRTVTCYVQARCSGGYSYAAPAGYRMTSCADAGYGTYGGCSTCRMSKVTVQCAN
ncbi:Carboxypeptidase regulatory-like domain protein [uncultured archaeon]|nr:Carboxypeptidase regulatory-like domain protein [uncultured archaeon]